MEPPNKKVKLETGPSAEERRLKIVEYRLRSGDLKLALTAKKDLFRHIRIEQADLVVRQNKALCEINQLKRELKALPATLFFSTGAPALPDLCMAKILTYYVRLREKSIGFSLQDYSLSLYRLFDPKMIAIARVKQLSGFLRQHRFRRLIKSSVQWNSSLAPFMNGIKSKPPAWPHLSATDLIKGSSLSEVLARVPTLKFKAHHASATLWGPEGMLVIKCPCAKEVFHNCARSSVRDGEIFYYLHLFSYTQKVELLRDGSGFKIPYTDAPNRLCCWEPMKICSRCRLTFYIDPFSMQIHVARLN